MKSQLVSTAMTIMGSGWAALVWDPVSRRLGTTQIHDHQSEITQGGIPLLVIDGWEHASYLQYQTDKAKFFEALWNLWRWPDVALCFEAAQRLDLALCDAAEQLPPTLHSRATRTSPACLRAVSRAPARRDPRSGAARRMLH